MESAKQHILSNVEKALNEDHTCWRNPKSWIVNDSFLDMFACCLKAHHATHSAKKRANKKQFEYIFEASCNWRGIEAVIEEKQKRPEDVHLLGDIQEDFQLKSEAAKNLKCEEIYISKYREARAIRDCTTKKKLIEFIHDVIIPHTQSYKSIFMLRSQKIPRKEQVQYKLLEIPTEVVRSISGVKSQHIQIHRGKNKSYTVKTYIPGKKDFVMDWYFCGGVEKVSVKNLHIKSCLEHANWTVKCAKT